MFICTLNSSDIGTSTYKILLFLKSLMTCMTRIAFFNIILEQKFQLYNI